jgi:hypothetical protein
MSAMAFLWQREKEPYIYDRREWIKGNLILTACFGFLVFWYFFMAIFTIPLVYFYISLVVSPLLLLADDCSIRISLTASKIYLQQGFCWHKRTINYDEIVDIAFVRDSDSHNMSSTYNRIARLKLFRNQHFTAGAKGPPLILFFLNNNDYCIVKTELAKDVLNVIKKVQPHIKID